MVAKYLKSTALALALAAGLAGAASAAEPSLDLVGPLAEYKIYVSENTAKLVTDTHALVAAIKAGDVAKAKALFAPTRTSYEKIEPIAELFADLDSSIDARADDFEKKEQDPTFTGFHRIEYGLWTTGSTEGLAPVAARLATDAGALRDRLKTLDLGPADLAGNAASLARRVSDQATASQAPYSQSDLAEFSADLDGIAKSALLIEPLVAEARPEVSATFHDAIATARKTLDGFRAADGSVPAYGSVDAAGRAKISAAFAQVADAAAALNPAIGLD